MDLASTQLGRWLPGTRCWWWRWCCRRLCLLHFSIEMVIVTMARLQAWSLRQPDQLDHCSRVCRWSWPTGSIDSKFKSSALLMICMTSLVNTSFFISLSMQWYQTQSYLSLSSTIFLLLIITIITFVSIPITSKLSPGLLHRLSHPPRHLPRHLVRSRELPLWQICQVIVQHEWCTKCYTCNNTLWFCILKSLQHVLKSPQITPEVPKSVHLGHIFLLGLAKTVFLHCPVLHVSTRVEKKQAMCITN